MVALTMGLKIVIANEDEQRDGAALNQRILLQQIDLLQTTPSRMTLLLEGNDCLPVLQQLKIIMLGGEPLPSSLLERIRKRTAPRG